MHKFQINHIINKREIFEFRNNSFGNKIEKPELDSKNF